MPRTPVSTSRGSTSARGTWWCSTTSHTRSVEAGGNGRGKLFQVLSGGWAEKCGENAHVHMYMYLQALSYPHKTIDFSALYPGFLRIRILVYHKFYDTYFANNSLIPRLS